MELQTAIEILEYHQEWRLGKREDMIHEPKKLTEALDIVLSEVKKNRLGGVSGSVSVEDALAFAEYFRNNFDYYDRNANGRVYKWIDHGFAGQSAMTMKQIFDYWQSHSN